jgi:iron complex transport system substrate-binding protein
LKPKLLIALLAAAALVPAVPAAAAKPRRVMSMNQCADQLVMMLLDPGRIGSVTYLAQSGAVSPALAAKARGLRTNHGLAEEVLAQKPDLIVAGAVTTPLTRRLARQIGIPLIALKPARSFEDIRSQMRRLGQALGEPARAEAWIARMDATLAELARTAPAHRIAVAAWNGAGRAPGKASLFDAILTAAGGYDVAANDGASERSLDLEQLLTLKPQPEVLLYGVSQRTRAGARAEVVRHPVLLRAYGSRRLSYPENAYACGTPYAADAATDLRKAMLSAVTRAEPRR